VGAGAALNFPSLVHRGRTVASLLLTLGGTAEAQRPDRLASFHHERWGTEDGLPGSRVDGVVQSADGYLWLGTDAGLARFDGLRFTTVGPGDSAGAIPFLRPLLADRRGRLWIATPGRGLVVYADGRFAPASPFDPAAEDIIDQLTESASGKLWAVGRRGSAWAWDGRRLVPPGWPASHSTGIRAVQEDSTGAVWTAWASGGVTRRGPGPARTLTTRDGLSSNEIWAIHLARDGALWLGTSAGVTRWRDEKATAFRLGPGRVAATVMAEDQEGAIWVGTRGDGLYRIANDRVSRITSTDGLSDDQVLALEVDHEGSIWVGTEDGLDRVERTVVQALTSEKGLPLGAPGALAWTDGTIWIAPVTGGLFRGNAGAGGFGAGRFAAVAAKALAQDRVVAVAPDHRGGLWLATGSGGLTRLRPDGRLSSLPTRGLTTRSITAVLEDRSGAVWAGTDGGVVRLDGGHVIRYTRADGLPGDIVRCLLEDRQGTIWVGMAGGLARIRGDSVTSYTAKDGLAGRDVVSLLEAADGNLWAGLWTGLTRIRDGRLTPIGVNQGLVERAVLAIEEDAVGHLWLAGDEGVSRVALEELNAVAGGRAKRVNPVVYGPQEGLPGSSAARDAFPTSLRTPDGRLWFSLSRGIAIIDPARLRPNPVPPPVHIEALTVDGRDVPPAERVTIPPHAQRIELRFTGISLLVPRQVRFRYILEGLDRDWVEAGSQRSATYTHLRPGAYRFRVVAANNDGVWNQAGASLAIRMLPAFYQSWWFYLLLVGALVLATYGALRSRQRQLERRFALVLAERTRLAREIHDTLLQGFTGITLQLQALLGRLAIPAEAKEEFERVLGLADRTLVDARRAVWDMRTPELERQGLADALVQAARAAADGSEIEVRSRVLGKPRRLAPAVEAALFRIGQEAAANAVKHADSRVLEVELAYQRRAVRLVVRDDGRGFPTDEEVRGHAGHWGLIGMHERAEQAGGRLTITGREGHGTEVVVTVPAR
jgi:signal transduction histidine kinase/ligand-binding sensor domain-containing protein